MPMLGVTIAIIDGSQVLLTRREDFEVWCLPGGAVDDGESLAAAAIREAREETGLEIELTRLVGIYSRPKGWHSTHLVLFAARVIGGALRPDPHEVIEAGYFGLNTLPAPLLPGHRRQILDALSGKGGNVWSYEVAWPFAPDITRQELYALRDRSGLTRQEFYVQHMLSTGDEQMLLEVDGCLAAD
ncbi:MAG TPA: NUDIX domain-containing protein [Roseiflexaceae bacterium]|nr:NUDIX domain-containing protein [Roseiflexaceae bacterium]